MRLSISSNCFWCCSSFSFALRLASALPKRAREISSRCAGNRARLLLSALFCSARSPGAGTLVSSAASASNNSRSALAFCCRRRSTPASSRSHNSAAVRASLRLCTTGFFSSSRIASARFCSFAFCRRCSSIFFSPSSIWAMRSVTSFCSCSSFFKATISVRSSGKLTACATPSRPSAISLFCSTRFSWRNAIRVFCRRTFSPSSRSPVRIKLTP